MGGVVAVPLIILRIRGDELYAVVIRGYDEYSFYVLLKIFQDKFYIPLPGRETTVKQQEGRTTCWI